MPRERETSQPREGLQPWQRSLLRRPCLPAEHASAEIAASVAEHLLANALSRRVLVRPAQRDHGNGREVAWHARLRRIDADTSVMVGIDTKLGRAVADAVSTEITSIRGDGRLGSVERGILDFVALQCLDEIDRAAFGPPYELLNFGGDASPEGSSLSWFEVTVGGQTGHLLLPLNAPTAASTSTDSTHDPGDALVLTCGVPVEAPPELLDTLAPGDLVLAGLPRDGIVEIRSASGWIVGTARLLEATRERLEAEFVSVGVRPATGPWVGLGEHRCVSASVAPLEVGGRLDLQMTSPRGNATMTLADGRRLPGEAVTLEGRDAIRILGTEPTP